MKVCVVGAGYWGPNLIRTFNDLGVLAGVFDLNKSSLEKLSKNTSYRDVYFGTDWEVALGRENIAAVILATPPNTHHEMAIKALKQDRHVFIEKPMTLKAWEAEEITTLARLKNLIVMVGHIFLYSPEIIKLKQLITSEDFGSVQYVYTKRLNLGKIQSPANVVDDLAPHDISILDYLLDKTCTEVSVCAKAHVLHTEDVAFINMKYDDVLCNLHLSWLDPLKVRDTIVVGTKQMAVCDSINKKISLYNKGVDIEEIEKGMDTYAGHLLSYRYGDEIIPYIASTEPMKVECQEFLNCIKENRQPLSDGNLGLSVVKVLEAMKLSNDKNGKWVKV